MTSVSEQGLGRGLGSRAVKLGVEADDFGLSM